MLKSMFVVRHIHIDNSQGHKDERLQGNDQDMKNRPHKLQPAGKQPHADTCAVHDRNQNKDHLARVHVAEQPQ